MEDLQKSKISIMPLARLDNQAKSNHFFIDFFTT